MSPLSESCAEGRVNVADVAPTLYELLGITPPDADPATIGANHSPRFFADEGALPVGVRANLRLALARGGYDVVHVHFGIIAPANLLGRRSPVRRLGDAQPPRRPLDRRPGRAERSRRRPHADLPGHDELARAGCAASRPGSTFTRIASAGADPLGARLAPCRFTAGSVLSGP